jgi:hypothetical protein
MSEIKGEPTDNELSEVDAKLLSPGWINLLDGAGLSYRERLVIGWALRVAPRLRRVIEQMLAETGNGGNKSCGDNRLTPETIARAKEAI